MVSYSSIVVGSLTYTVGNGFDAPSVSGKIMSIERGADGVVTLTIERHEGAGRALVDVGGFSIGVREAS